MAKNLKVTRIVHLDHTSGLLRNLKYTLRIEDAAGNVITNRRIELVQRSVSELRKHRCNNVASYISVTANKRPEVVKYFPLANLA